MILPTFEDLISWVTYDEWTKKKENENKRKKNLVFINYNINQDIALPNTKNELVFINYDINQDMSLPNTKNELVFINYDINQDISLPNLNNNKIKSVANIEIPAGYSPSSHQHKKKDFEEAEHYYMINEANFSTLNPILINSADTKKLQTQTNTLSLKHYDFKKFKIDKLNGTHTKKNNKLHFHDHTFRKKR